MNRVILVCGGAGYIGSHMVKMLIDEGYTPLVLDNLSTGYKDAIPSDSLINVSLLDTNAVKKVFLEYSIDAVMHFAAKSLVGESVSNPLLYYENNVSGTISLLQAMQSANVNKIIFSSTAAVYGVPQETPISEVHSLAPINPYGLSKVMAEQIIQESFKPYGISSVRLRYFNAAGAHPEAILGERHFPETHLIPNVLLSLLDGEREFTVFGNDYPTDDGFCVRDYIHVCDLCKAHLLALRYLEKHSGSYTFNLGSGIGYSIKQILEVTEKVTGKKISYSVKGRREGDPAILIASASCAYKELGWKPVFSDIETIIQTAWNWHKSK